MNFINQHGIELLLGYYALSAAASSMPAPTVQDGKGYQFLYHFAHILVGDLSQYLDTRIPKP